MGKWSQKQVDKFQRQDLVHTPFVPVEKPASYYDTIDERKLYGRRIFWSLFLTLFAVGILVLYYFNPVIPYLDRPLFMEEAALSWAGLLDKASILTFISFLVILLARYIFILFSAIIFNIQYTVRYSHKNNDFTPPISVIVPAYNEGKLIETTLKSLLALDYPQYEIIVVDDGSKDDTGEVVASYVGDYQRCTIKLITKPNGGKASALNAGIEKAQYEFVLCMDGDSMLTPDTLTNAIRHLKDEKIGAVAGNVKVANRDNIWTTLQALEYIEGLNIARAAQSFFKLVNIIPGPVGLFRKKVIKEVGWYESDTFAEDCDMTIKLMRAGWRIVYEPRAIAWTEAPNTLLSLLKQRYRWTRGILQALHKKHKKKWSGFMGRLFVWFMAFESLIWPFMNVFANVYFVYIAVAYNFAYYLALWWIGLALLDLAAALYAIAVEREELRLVFYALFYRIFFILIIDVCKVFATIEELLGLRMNWGKLDRIGTVKPEPATV